MYTLCINDKNNQTQPWWFNFLFSLQDTDVKTGLKKWGGRIDYDRNTKISSTRSYCKSLC
jgi:hypothetical protein